MYTFILCINCAFKIINLTGSSSLWMRVWGLAGVCWSLGLLKIAWLFKYILKEVIWAGCGWWLWESGCGKRPNMLCGPSRSCRVLLLASCLVLSLRVGSWVCHLLAAGLGHIAYLPEYPFLFCSRPVQSVPGVDWEVWLYPGQGQRALSAQSVAGPDLTRKPVYCEFLQG